MDCSKRIFILHDKHGDRYVHAVRKEETARAIVEERIQDGYYSDKEMKKINSLEHLESTTFPFYKFLVSRKKAEYENFDEVYLEELN